MALDNLGGSGRSSHAHGVMVGCREGGDDSCAVGSDTRHTRRAASHRFVAQSYGDSHAPPTSHGGQVPPQSMSVSSEASNAPLVQITLVGCGIGAGDGGGVGGVDCGSTGDVIGVGSGVCTRDGTAKGVGIGGGIGAGDDTVDGIGVGGGVGMPEGTDDGVGVYCVVGSGIGDSVEEKVGGFDGSDVKR